MSIVAIVSGIYCSGEEIAKRVAERLEYSFVGDELLVEAAARFGTSVGKLSRVLTGSRGLLDGITHDYDKSFIHLKAAVADLVGRDSVVYHGWAVHLIPREIEHILRVGLVADRDFRVGVATAVDDISAKDAAVRIRKSDEDLAAWTQEIRGRGPWDAALYDIKIPMQTSDVENAVDLICDAATKVAIRPTDRSVQAAMDFRLAMAVNLALLDQGHHYCDVTSSEGHLTIFIRRKPSSWGQLGRAVEAMRLEQLELEVMALAAVVEGVESVEVQPGSWHRRIARTLLVDDEQEYVLTLSERLQMRDIPSEVVYDGEQALTVVETETPDVMVLDLRMPGIDGLEVLRRVRRDHPHVQVIVVTGHGSKEDERIARELGAFEYLEKPVDITRLAETIQKASSHADVAPTSRDKPKPVSSPTSTEDE